MQRTTSRADDSAARSRFTESLLNDVRHSVERMDVSERRKQTIPHPSERARMHANVLWAANDDQASVQRRRTPLAAASKLAPAGVPARSPRRSWGFVRCFSLRSSGGRIWSETRSDQASCRSAVSRISGRCRRPKGSRHPYGTHRPALDVAAAGHGQAPGQVFHDVAEAALHYAPCSDGNRHAPVAAHPTPRESQGGRRWLASRRPRLRLSSEHHR
jgi:hypothetical protein